MRQAGSGSTVLTAVSTDTVFDLASLTKVLATTTLALDLVAQGRLDLDREVHRYLPAWSGEDRQRVTVADLLEHTSGLPGYRDYFRTLNGRHQFLAAIAAEPLEYPTRSASTYSDLGFMILGFIIETVGGDGLDSAIRSLARTRGSAAHH